MRSSVVPTSDLASFPGSTSQPPAFRIVLEARNEARSDPSRRIFISAHSRACVYTGSTCAQFEIVLQ